MIISGARNTKDPDLCIDVVEFWSAVVLRLFVREFEVMRIQDALEKVDQGIVDILQNLFADGQLPPALKDTHPKGPKDPIIRSRF